MAGILIENGGYLKDILHCLGARDWSCNWLMTEVECYTLPASLHWDGGPLFAAWHRGEEELLWNKRR